MKDLGGKVREFKKGRRRRLGRWRVDLNGTVALTITLWGSLVSNPFVGTHKKLLFLRRSRGRAWAWACHSRSHCM